VTLMTKAKIFSQNVKTKKNKEDYNKR